MDNILLRYLTVQVIEKAIRLNRLFDIALDYGSDSERDVVDTFKRHLNSIKEDIFFAVTFLGPIERELPHNMYKSLFRIVTTSFHSLDELHLHLSYIQSIAIRPETPVFVRALFEPFSNLMKPKGTFSVVLSDTYMFEEVDLSLYLSEQAGLTINSGHRTPTLFLPKVESENPLQWGTLVHEMGHGITEPINEIFARIEGDVISGGTSKGKEMLLNWIEEVYCDVVSLHLLGPAYLASFIDFIVIIGSEGFLESFSLSHPPPRYRIWLMYQVLEKKGITANFLNPLYNNFPELGGFFYWLFEERCKAERGLFAHPLEDTSKLWINMRNFRDRIEEQVEDIVPFEKAIPTFDPRKFKKLYDRLQEGIPIGSYSLVKIESEDDEALEALRWIDKNIQCKEGTNREEHKEYLKKALKRVKETPCTVAEIINAGWLFKCERIYLDLIMDLNSLDPDMEQEFGRQLFRLDDLLRNSIETSFLNSLFSLGDIDKNGSN